MFSMLFCAVSNSSISVSCHARAALGQLCIRVQRAQSLPRFAIEPSIGLLTVPVDCSPAALRDFIEQRGPQAVHVMRKHQTQSNLPVCCAVFPFIFGSRSFSFVV